MIRDSLTTLANAAARPIKLGPKLLHEGVHLIGGAPWIAEWNIVIGPTGSDRELDVYVDFVDDAPTWGIVLSYLAPMLTGLLGLLVAGILIWTYGLPLAPTATDLLLWAAAGLGWVLYTAPSVQDVHGALETLDGNVGDEDV